MLLLLSFALSLLCVCDVDLLFDVVVVDAHLDVVVVVGDAVSDAVFMFMFVLLYVDDVCVVFL